VSVRQTTGNAVGSIRWKKFRMVVY